MTALARDSLALVGRHMRHISRVPEKLLNVTVLPVVFVVVFGYLFGSVMVVPGGDYLEFVMAGIFTQVMIAGLGSTAVGVAWDLRNGLVERFRSLPIRPSAVLLGRTVSDLLLSALACASMAVVGLLSGWRPHRELLATLAAFGLLMLMGFAMAWLGALCGLIARDVEATNAVTLMLIMPLMFLSNVFIPLDELPGWFQNMAVWNPASLVVTACRELFGNPIGALGSGLPARHPVALALVMLAVWLIVIVPVTVRLYRVAAAR